MEGLIPKANLTQKGLLREGVLSYFVYIEPNKNKQMLAIKRLLDTGIQVSCLLSVYFGGNVLLLSITISDTKFYIANLSDKTKSGLFTFYTNNTGDLIIRAFDNVATLRCGLLILDTTGVNLSQCLTINNEDVSSMEKVEIH